MNKNYLFILVVVGYFIFSGCDNDKNYTFLKNYRVINQTDNNLFCEIINETWDSTETKSSFVNPNDSTNFLFSHTVPYWNRYHTYYLADILLNIYNLNDTTKLIKHEQTYPKPVDNGWHFIYNDEDKLENYLKIDSKNDGVLGSYRLFIDTDKLSLFEKDYSMLEKFPEYYGN